MQHVFLEGEGREREGREEKLCGCNSTADLLIARISPQSRG